MQALITRGCVTDHGGIVQEGDHTFLIEGIAVHLEGMSHFCPKCKVMVQAMSSKRGFLMSSGRSIIAAGDTATCGAKFFLNQHLVVREGGSPSSSTLYSGSALTSLLDQTLFDEQVFTQFEFAEGMPYFIETESGQTYKGVVRGDGKLPRVQTEGAYQVYLGEEAMIKGGDDAS